MLSKKEINEIRERFTQSGMDRPLQIQGEHIKSGDNAVSMGWNVESAKGAGIHVGDKEYAVRYASNTTFEAASFLVHLPVDIANLLATIENLYHTVDKLAINDPNARAEAKAVLKDYTFGTKEDVEPSEAKETGQKPFKVDRDGPANLAYAILEEDMLKLHLNPGTVVNERNVDRIVALLNKAVGK